LVSETVRVSPSTMRGVPVTSPARATVGNESSTATGGAIFDHEQPMAGGEGLPPACRGRPHASERSTRNA
jgi:hypothetical protein